MPKYPYSTNGQAKLLTCDVQLQALFNEVANYANCTIQTGHRPEWEQNEAYEKKTSTVRWPDSKHNKLPSLAVDVVPFPIVWPDFVKTKERARLGDTKAIDDYARDLGRLYMFVGLVRGIAHGMGIKIRCGADWDGDMDVKDQNFHDLPHFELED